jgi:hypothetical protein
MKLAPLMTYLGEVDIVQHLSVRTEHSFACLSETHKGVVVILLKNGQKQATCMSILEQYEAACLMQACTHLLHLVNLYLRQNTVPDASNGQKNMLSGQLKIGDEFYLVMKLRSI